jgi:DNA-directed RNA polymerase specialized sigma24 family protein
MNSVDAAVARWSRRVGSYPVFGVDDARQEAAIAVWITGRDLTMVAYAGIIDAMRRLVPGFRQHAQPLMADEPERIDSTTPEDVAAALEIIGRLSSLPGQQRDVVAALVDGEPGDSIARRLGMTPGRVSQIKSEARASILRQWGHEWPR